MRAYQAAYYIDGLERNRLDNKQRDGSSIRIARLLFGRASISSEEIREREQWYQQEHTLIYINIAYLSAIPVYWLDLSTSGG